MADLNLSIVPAGLKIVSESSSFILNEWSTKINTLSKDEITIISDVQDNYAELDLNFADYDNVYLNGVISGDAIELQSSLSLARQVTDVFVQDQFTPTMIVKFNKIHAQTTIATETVIDSYSVIVANASGISIGDYLILYSAASNRYSFFTVLNKVTNTLTVDTPIDFAYPIGANADAGVTNMSLNGSVTPQFFGIRGTETGNEVPTTIDITRIIFKCITDDPVDLSKFGDLTSLTRGLVLRKKDGEIRNIFNVKNNGDIAGIMLDWYPYAASNPSQGVNGFTARLTFSGKEKLGVTVRLAPGEDLQFIIQDNLEGLVILEVVAEGSEVE